MAPGIGDLLRRLGGGAKPGKSGSGTVFPPTQYKDFTITPVPHREGGHWLVAGVISKQTGDEIQEHRFLRGDRYTDIQSAAEFSVTKGQQMIDLEGDRLFGRTGAP